MEIEMRRMLRELLVVPAAVVLLTSAVGSAGAVPLSGMADKEIAEVQTDGTVHKIGDRYYRPDDGDEDEVVAYADDAADDDDDAYEVRRPREYGLVPPRPVYGDYGRYYGPPRPVYRDDDYVPVRPYPRYGYAPPPPPPVYYAPPVVEWVPPPRPASCGQYRYWDGDRCRDARWAPPYVGPRR
jgi:hypothetical protein